MKGNEGRLKEGTEVREKGKKKRGSGERGSEGNEGSAARFTN